MLTISEISPLLLINSIVFLFFFAIWNRSNKLNTFFKVLFFSLGMLNLIVWLNTIGWIVRTP
jgi:hypothetical protein